MKLGNNISVARKYDDSVFFRATCGCMSDNHDRTIVVEEDDGIISCTIYTEFKYYDWAHSNSNVFLKALSRVKAAVKVLFSGYMRFDGEYMFNDAKSARDYANAILGAVDEFEKRSVSSVQEGTGNN